MLFRSQTKGLVSEIAREGRPRGSAAAAGRTCWCWKMVQQPDVPPTTADDNFSSSFTVSYPHSKSSAQNCHKRNAHRAVNKRPSIQAGLRSRVHVPWNVFKY